MVMVIDGDGDGDEVDGEMVTKYVVLIICSSYWGFHKILFTQTKLICGNHIKSQ